MNNQINYSKITRYENLSFEEYKKLSGIGFSTAKAMKNGVVEDINITQKILVGKLVDEILTNNHFELQLDPLYPAAKSIATEIKSTFNDILPSLTPQISYHGEMRYQDLIMETTGRLDFELPKRMIIDLKVNNSCRSYQDCLRLIDFMHYDKQAYNYCSLSGIWKYFILIYSTVAKKCFLIRLLDTKEKIQIAEEWWIQKIIDNGTI